MGAPVALLLSLPSLGRSLLKAAFGWLTARWERPIMIGLAVMGIVYVFFVVPSLEKSVADWQKATAAEVAAHQQTKDDYAKGMLAAEEKARANVEAEMERQDNENAKAVASYRAGTDDLDLRAERLRGRFNGAGVASASCRPNLPSSMASAGGAADATGAGGFPLPIGGSDGDQPAGLIDPSMSIDERVRCTRYAHQLDAILDIDEAVGEADKSGVIQEH